jgi:hypothetical protein
MQIYWSLKSIPELNGLERSKRGKVWRACCLRPFRHWQAWVISLSPFVVMFIGAVLGLWIDGQMWVLFGRTSPEVGELRFPAATVGLMLGAGFFASLVFGQIFSQIMRPYLRNYLETHNVA